MAYFLGDQRDYIKSEFASQFCKRFRRNLVQSYIYIYICTTINKYIYYNIYIYICREISHVGIYHASREINIISDLADTAESNENRPYQQEEAGNLLRPIMTYVEINLINRHTTAFRGHLYTFSQKGVPQSRPACSCM